MTEPLRILILEDVPADALLVERELSRAGMEITSRRVETREDFLAGLEAPCPDVIISDYRLPTLDGMEALALALERAPLVPFIITTGSINEETAVECMKAGAWDYVLKDHLSRLPMAVSRALDLARTRRDREQVQAELARSEAENRAIVNAVPDLLFRLDRTGTFLGYRAGELTRLFAPPEAFLGQRVEAVLPANVAGPAREAVQRTLETGEISTFEYQLELRGEQRSFEARAIRISDLEALVVVRDITDRVRAETALREREEVYSAIVNQAVDGIVLIDPETSRFVEFNDAACLSLGYTREEFGALTVPDISGVLQREAVAGLVRKARETGGERLETKQRRKDRTLRDVRVSNRVVNVRGHEYLAAIWHDVTEQRLAAEALELFKHSIDFASDAAFWNDPDGRFLYANDAACKSVGYSRDELLQMRISEVNPRALPERWAAVWETLRATGTIQVEAVHRRKDGSEFPVDIVSTYVTFGDREYVCGFARDITERKRAEEALRENREMLRESQAIAGLGSYVVDIPTGTWKGSDVLDRVFGIDDSYERSVEGWAALIHPDDRATMVEYFAREVADEGRAFDREYRILRHDDQSVRWVHGLGRLELDAQGRPLRMRGTIQDITERRLAEDAVRDARTRYRLLFESSPDGIVVIEPSTGRILEFNQKAHQQLGYSSEEFARLSVSDIEIQETPEQTRVHIDKIRREGWDDFVTPQRTKQGETRWVHVTAQYTEEAGFPLYHCIWRDITERRIAEEALRKSEARFRSYFELPLHGIATSSTEKRWTQVNDRLCSILGYSRDELLKMTWAEMTYPEDLEQNVRSFDRLLSGEITHYDLEKRFVRKDGKVIWTSVSVGCVRRPDGGVDYLVVLVEDISERKAVEDALRESEERYRLIAENTADVIWTLDLATRRLTYVSPSVEKLRGFTAEEVLAQPFGTSLTPESQRRVEATLGAAVAGFAAGDRSAATGTLEADMPTKDGGVVQTEIVATALADSSGRLTGVLGVTRDVTERKRAEAALRERERELATLMANLPGMVYRCSAQAGWPMEFVSEGCAALTGWSSADVMRQAPTFSGLILEEDRQGVQEAVEAALHARLPFEATYRIRRADGVVRSVWERGRGTFDSAGSMLFLEGFVTDVTAQTVAEDALRKSEERYRTLFEQSPIGIYRTTPDGRILVASPALLEMLGYASLDELAGRNLEAHGFEPGYPRSSFKEAIERDGELRGFEAVWETKDGRRLFVRETAHAFRDTSGRTMYFEGVVEDVTAESETREALRRTEEQYRHLFESSSDIIVVFEPRTETIVDANPKACELYGYSHEELIGSSLKRLTVDVGRGEERIAELLRGSPVQDFETSHLRRDGTAVDLQVSASIVDFGGTPAVLSTARDITQRKRSEEERRRLVAAIEQSAEAVVVTDTKGGIQYVNPAFEWITGYQAVDVIGQNPRVLGSGKHDASFYQEMWNTISHGSVWIGRLTNKRKDGSLYEEEMSISPVRDEKGEIINFVAVKRDVTREVELRQQLQQAQKMEAIGQLAGGIAHDFNNLLQALMSQIQLLKSRSKDPGGVVSLSLDLEQQVNRGASLTRQLLIFSRRETVKPERLDLNEVVRDSSRMLKRLVPANIALSLELASGELRVDADHGQLDQVLMNLTVNARDAMPEGGRLTITTGADANSTVWLRVEDTGHGIPPGIRDRIFDPFFTTKSAGKGTGLGLSVVHGIVAQHGGRIEVESVAGQGTAFKVILPKTGSGEFAAVTEAPSAVSELAVGKGERILVVEDEDVARQGLRDILASLGYSVVAVGSGEAAGELPEEPPIDLLLTDLMLPGVAGPALAAGLKDRWPALKVILMSGYTEDEAVRGGVIAGMVRFLQKPFDMKTLAREVRAALDERPDES